MLHWPNITWQAENYLVFFFTTKVTLASEVQNSALSRQNNWLELPFEIRSRNPINYANCELVKGKLAKNCYKLDNCQYLSHEFSTTLLERPTRGGKKRLWRVWSKRRRCERASPLYWTRLLLNYPTPINLEVFGIFLAPLEYCLPQIYQFNRQ